MVVKLVKRVVRGWKQEDNSRFGFCVVCQFVDDKTNKVLFEYAPTLAEKDFWGLLFNDVFDVDRLHKELINTYVRVDPSWSDRYFKDKEGDVC